MKTPTRILVGGPEVTSAFVLMGLALARQAMLRGRGSNRVVPASGVASGAASDRRPTTGSRFASQRALIAHRAKLKAHRPRPLAPWPNPHHNARRIVRPFAF